MWVLIHLKLEELLQIGKDLFQIGATLVITDWGRIITNRAKYYKSVHSNCFVLSFFLRLQGRSFLFICNSGSNLENKSNHQT